MTDTPPDQEAEDWWRTDIIRMKPGEIAYRGYPIEKLIGQAGFAEMVWLMTCGDLPSKGEAALLDTALMAAVDHGPQAPSIAISRMAATCGVDLNNAMASGLNVLGDVHGGAGEQAVAFYQQVAERWEEGAELSAAVEAEIDAFTDTKGKFLPGFGHRFHPIDPRAPALMAEVQKAAKAGVVTGRFAEIGQAIEATLAKRKGKPIPMNIDGATAVIYAELGFPAPLARGLFCLSRSVGLLAHAWEQMGQGGRNKGPLPRRLTWTYDGPDLRDPPTDD